MGNDAILLPYQQEAIRGIETHKYSIMLWARQTGKSFLASYYAFLTAVQKEKSLSVIVSASERQSIELLRKVKTHINATKAAGLLVAEEEQNSMHLLELKNLSRVISLPANPDTIRGFTADVLILDEFSFMQHQEELWRAAFPMITRKHNAKVIIISTPKTKKDIFYFLWQTAQQDSQHWFSYKLTIYDAVEKGLNINPEELKAGIKNDLAWKTEYLCEFMDSEEVLLPYEVIQACEEEGIEVEDLRLLKGEIFLGIDIGRRKDLTVISIVEKLGSVLYLRKQEILQNTPFSQQMAVIDHLCHYARRVAIDETGIGMQIAEELKRKWGEYKVLSVYFTAKTKEELASRLYTKFQDKTIRIPPDNDLREDLHSVKRLVSDKGNIRYEGGTEEGHADRFWSLALSIYAVSEPVWPVNIITKSPKEYREISKTVRAAYEI